MNIADVSMKPVDSSNIESLGYFQGNLFVRFMNGGIYKYRDVSEDIYQELLDAPSKGKFLNSSIKPNHKFERLN